jgi:hypothetical protein
LWIARERGALTRADGEAVVGLWTALDRITGLCSADDPITTYIAVFNAGDRIELDCGRKPDATARADTEHAGHEDGGLKCPVSAATRVWARHTK